MKQLLQGATVMMLLAQGCSTEPAQNAAPTPAPTLPSAPQPEASEVSALAAANAAADALGRTLRGRLLEAMAHGGPVEAAEVCAQEAPVLTQQLATKHHARLGRHSLRMRGSSSAPAWVQQWLEAQGERSAEGAVGFARVEDGHARVVRPIAVDASCLTCHGEHVAPEVSAILSQHYPADRATGYALGALRGALWAEVEVAP